MEDEDKNVRTVYFLNNTSEDLVERWNGKEVTIKAGGFKAVPFFKAELWLQHWKEKQRAHGIKEKELGTDFAISEVHPAELELARLKGEETPETDDGEASVEEEPAEEEQEEEDETPEVPVLDDMPPVKKPQAQRPGRVAPKRKK